MEALKNNERDIQESQRYALHRMIGRIRGSATRIAAVIPLAVAMSIAPLPSPTAHADNKTGVVKTASHPGSALGNLHRKAATDTGDEESGSCESTINKVVASSGQVDTALEQEFNQYGNTGNEWIGADGGVSARLPDGRELWIFSDTFFGQVVNNTLPSGTKFLHNSMVVQNGQSMATLFSGTEASPLSFFNDSNPNNFYWNNGAIISGNSLYVSYSEYTFGTGQGFFSFKELGTVIAKFSLPGITLQSVTPVGMDNNITWGVWMMKDVGYTYIYGSAPNAATGQKQMYLARAPGNDIISNWQYFNGTGWSSNPLESAPISDVAQNAYSVMKLGSFYVLVTMKNVELSNQVMTYLSCSPSGPFVDGTQVYITTGQAGLYGTYGDPNVYTYCAYAHPELTNGNTIVISYDVNSLNGSDLATNAYLFRPRFIEVSVKVSSGSNGRDAEK